MCSIHSTSSFMIIWCPQFLSTHKKKCYWVYLFTSTAELIISLTLMWIQSTFAPWCASEFESDFMCFYSFLQVLFIIFFPLWCLQVSKPCFWGEKRGTSESPKSLLGNPSWTKCDDEMYITDNWMIQYELSGVNAGVCLSVEWWNGACGLEYGCVSHPVFSSSSKSVDMRHHFQKD